MISISKNRAIKVVLFLLVFIIFPSIFMVDANAWKNMPVKINEVPFGPEDYNFKEYDGWGTYKESHYGTHDWIADAALRLLYEENPSDWGWLIHEPSDVNPQWNSAYGTAGKHNAIRSYISFLFATQMPDMSSDKKNEPIPKKHPVMISGDINTYEGEIIARNKGDPNTGDSWIGTKSRFKQQQYRWIPFHITLEGEKFYLFTTGSGDNYKYLAPSMAKKMGLNAIRCLANSEQISQNWAKPEAAACYLGIMTHYLADLSCPAHVLKPTVNTKTGVSKGYYYLEYRDTEHKVECDHFINGFHDSIEYQTEKHTTWDEDKGGPLGYNGKYCDYFFIVDMKRIGKGVKPIPSDKSPALCAIELAQKTIVKSYGHIDGSGYGNGFDKKGLFVNEDVYEKLDKNYVKFDSENRDETESIIPNGLSYKEYFDKVEFILNWGIYYTACAMKWVLEEAKKKNNAEDNLNFNRWVNNPYVGQQDADSEAYPKDQSEFEDPDEEEETKKLVLEKWFQITAMAAPIAALVLIPLLSTAFRNQEKKITH